MSRTRVGYDLKRDRAVLEHLARFRVSTLRVVHRLLFGGRTPSAAKKVLNRLERQGLLRSFRMNRQGQKCYQLSSAGAYRLGASDKLARPLRTQAFAKRLAVACFINTHGPKPYRLLTAAEAEAAFPGTAEGFPDALYYPDDSAGPHRLALLRPDYGSTDARRVVRQCQAEVNERFAHQAFRRLIQARLFQVTVLTSTAEKAERLRALLAEAGGFPSRVEFVPELFHVIGV